MKCEFCFAVADDPKLTKEHVLSQPVAEAFGIERRGPFGRFGSPDDLLVTDLNSLTVRAVCDTCNNGWMNQLEHQMADVAAWMSGGELGVARAVTVHRWMLKTYAMLCALNGCTRRIATGEESGVFPDYTRFRCLYENDPAAFTNVFVGASAAEPSDRFAYFFGNPTVVPKGPQYAGMRSAGGTILTLGPLQLWIVVPLSIFPDARVRGPRRVRELSPTLRFDQLRTTRVPGDLQRVVVDNGEHDFTEFFACANSAD